MLSDERLARLVGEGNERAFATLYSRFHQPLYRYCHSMVRHEPDAQDALQSTFTAALSALRRGQRDAPLRPWLFRIAHNESISLLRRRRVTEELPETMEAPASSVEAMAEERARLALLVSDLQALPERQRGALVMRELSGLSHEDVAQALGISVGAAKQTVFEARQALQEFSEGRAMACEDIQRVVSDGDKRALRGRRVRAHFRECPRCQTFAQAIPERRAALLALTPALPAAAASGLFGRIVGASGAHHGTGGGLLASAGTKSLGVALSAKTVAAGVAIVATATVGAVGAVEVVNHSGHHAASTSLVRNDGQGAAGSGSGAAGVHGRLASASHGRAGLSGHGRPANHSHPGKSGAASHGARNGQHGLSGASSTTSNATGSSSSPSTGSGNAGGNSTTHSGSPNAGGTNPNAHGGNPNAGGGNSSGSGNAGGTNPNAHGGNPNAGGGNVNAHGGNPSAGGGSTNAHGGNPNARGGNSNGTGSSTGTGTTGPSGVTGNTNAHGGNPHAHGGH